MCENCCPRYAKYVVYFLIFIDIVGGGSYFFAGMSRLKDDAVTALVAATMVPTAALITMMGILLFLGVYQQNEKYVFAYIAIRSAFLAQITLFCVIVMEILEFDGGAIFGVVIFLLLLWGLKYTVYLYYKEMVKFKETSVNTGDFAITYNERNDSYINTGVVVDNTAV